MVSARGISRSIGVFFSIIGMVGLVLWIVTLLPLNGYNIYISVDGLLQVIRHELERTNNDWTAFSWACKLYIVYFTGTILCSTFDFGVLFLVCCGYRKQPDEEEEVEEVEEEQMIEQRQDSSEDNGQTSRGKTRKRKVNRSILFNRVVCVNFVLQIAWALFGTHLYFYLNNDDIPATIGAIVKISLLILWLNYLALTLFAIVLFCASFFILLGGKKTRYQDQQEETRPLIL